MAPHWRALLSKSGNVTSPDATYIQRIAGPSHGMQVSRIKAGKTDNQGCFTLGPIKTVPYTGRTSNIHVKVIDPGFGWQGDRQTLDAGQEIRTKSSLEGLISRLRRKLKEGNSPGKELNIVSSHGFGYCLSGSVAIE